MLQFFPNLAQEGYAQISPPDPGNVFFWPTGAPRAVTLAAFYRTFALMGYERCDDGNLEEGFEKVAFFELAGFPTRAARQLADGSWTSKLGKNVDITHTLRGLEGPLYGRVAGFMKRPNR